MLASAMVNQTMLFVPLLLVANLHGQSSIGSLKTEGAEVSGLVTVSGGRAVIGNQGAVVAGSQASEISLQRGGSIKVCAGSSVHVSQPSLAAKKPPLMMALDRGAVEIRTGAEKTDAILTPDLRFELSDGVPLDLRMRVIANGDTCVENAGKDAPVLHVTETFGDAAYFIRPGQRVLFEHGSLREVVDHEDSGCGCPRGNDLVLAGKGHKATEAAKSNPFPEDVSVGLKKPETPQPAAVGEVVTKVNSTLNYSGPANAASGPPGQSTTMAEAVSGDPVPASPAAPAAPASVKEGTPGASEIHLESAAPPPAGPNPFRAIGRFFRKIFGVH